MNSKRLRRWTATTAAITAMAAMIVGAGPAASAGAGESQLAFARCAPGIDVSTGSPDLGPDGYLIFVPADGSAPCTLDACTEQIDRLIEESFLSTILGPPLSVDQLVELGLLPPCDLPPPPPPEPFFAPCPSGVDMSGGVVSDSPDGFVVYIPWEFFQTLDFSLPCTLTECSVTPDEISAIREFTAGTVLPCPDQAPVEPEPAPAWQPGDGRPPWAGRPAHTPGDRPTDDGGEDDSPDLPTTG